jgi:hypothetical protein
MAGGNSLKLVSRSCGNVTASIWSATRLLVVGNAVEKFDLDLATILQNFRQNGELHGDLPAKKLGNKAPWKALLGVVEGTVISCQILDNRGAVVNSGELALEALYKLGPLNWEVIPEPPEGTGKLPAFKPTRKSGALPASPTGTAPLPNPAPAQAPTPYRLMDITLKQMNQTQWPRDYRLVYILVDGTRTNEKIASMLAMPVSDVEQILRELQSMRIIDLNP